MSLYPAYVKLRLAEALILSVKTEVVVCDDPFFKNVMRDMDTLMDNIEAAQDPTEETSNLQGRMEIMIKEIVRSLNGGMS
jgi:hypothetical protein